jgi:hypothetical protein
MAAPASSFVLSRRFIPAFRQFCCGILLITNLTTAQAAKWATIPSDQLADTKPQVDPEAGAEILFREVTIDHSSLDGFSREHFIRAKIYSERGVEDFTKIELPYDNDTEIRNIAVRTIKPDGQIIELTKKDIYDREIVKAGKERVKVKAFSPAGVQPGAIIEYTYTEVTGGWEFAVSMFFQSNLPSRHVRYRLRPIDFSKLYYADARNMSIRTLSFNCPSQPMKADDGGYFPFEMRNIPAAREEPDQPPRLNCQSSIIVYYSFEKQLAPKAYWEKQGADLHKRMLKETKPDKLVRTTLDGVLAPGDSEDTKLRKIYDFCRTKLVNRYNASAHFTREQREKFKPNETAADTLKTGHGSSEDINIVFVALARAAGLDARYANAGNRAFLLFNPSLTESFMASDLITAVQLNGKWQFFDPGVRYLSYALPYWSNSFTGAIIASPKNAEIVDIGHSPSTESRLKRKATLHLDVDGTLEGDVSFEYTGHQAVFQKFSLDYKTPAERETQIREDIQTLLKLAEVTDLKVENATDPTAPLKISFHLRIPEYADRTGSRLFFQPAVFQKNEPPRFPEPTRRTDIMFRYCYEDYDDIRIMPPEGYELEEASSPGSLDLGQMGAYDIVAGKLKGSEVLVYRRTFALRAINIPVAMYPAVQTAFDQIHKRDAHTLTLRRKTSTVTPSPDVPAASTAKTIGESTPTASNATGF